jgi:flagellar biosynthesis/type III secretory pathway protein FliH
VDLASGAAAETQAPLPAAPQPRDALGAVAAAESLRLIGARLAEQARSDSLEIAFSIARRILDAELSASPAPLFAMVRSAVRRVGEAREVVLRVSPASAAMVEAQPRESLGLTMAKVSIVADASLQGGDCIVESDLGTVDGRLGSRLEELRRALAEAIPGDAA